MTAERREAARLRRSAKTAAAVCRKSTVEGRAGRADQKAKKELVRRAAARGMLDAQATRLSALLEHPDMGVRVKAQIDLRLLEESEKRKAHDAAVADGLAETISLEARRGERVERRKGGAVLVHTRDVLKTLWRGGTITTAQYRAGLHYQALMELADPEKALTPPPLIPTARGGGVTPEPLQERIARAKDELAAANRYLAACSGPVERVVLAVGWCAGSNRPISTLASSGHMRSAYTAALVHGLGVLATAWKLD